MALSCGQACRNCGYCGSLDFTRWLAPAFAPNALDHEWAELALAEVAIYRKSLSVQTRQQPRTTSMLKGMRNIARFYADKGKRALRRLVRFAGTPRAPQPIPAPVASHPMQHPPRQVINCAHRGASGHAPENTLAAIQTALELGAEMCEIDVQQTRDDLLVVFHDKRLERTTNGRGYLWSKTSDELHQLDAGAWFAPKFAGEPIPLLEEVIAAVRGRAWLNIEVKLHRRERHIERLVVETIRRLNFAEECIITCFDPRVTIAIKGLAPEMRTGYIFGTSQFDGSIFKAPVDVLSANYRLVDADFVQRAHAAGKEVHVWTVNSRTAIRRMLRRGVDAIISNYPDRVAKLMAEHGRGRT